jgi:hypothetical protein
MNADKRGFYIRGKGVMKKRSFATESTESTESTEGTEKALLNRIFSKCF